MADADIGLLLAGHGLRRAEFHGDGVDHLVITARVDGEQFFEQRQPFFDACLAIGDKGLLGGGHGPVNVFGRAHRDHRNRLFRRRVQDLEVVGDDGIHPGAIDVELAFVEHSLLLPVSLSFVFQQASRG
ncbi:hypothetical protein D9M72_493580 [compost metagenome]